MNNLLKQIRKSLKTKIDKAYWQGSLNFFKEPVKLHGVRAKDLKKIESRFWPQVKILSKSDLIKLTENLFKSNFNEEFFLGSKWLYRRINEFNQTDFKLLENWLKKYVTNWGMCDDYCTHPLGYLIYHYPSLIKNTKIWTKSKNRWLKRASAVIHIHPAKLSSPFYQAIKKNRDKYLKNIFQIANALLLDNDDLVQKGYGWMLKETSNIWQSPVFNYILKNKKTMPRTALRYALEKLPKKLKKQAMR